MESYLSKQQRSQEKGKDLGPVLIALLVFIIIAASCAGCANATVVKLAEMCYGAANSGKPSVSFVGESGRVDCK